MLLDGQRKQQYQYKDWEYQYNRACEKLLQVKLNHKLAFDNHIPKMWKKWQKNSWLAKVTSYMNISKKNLILMNSYNLSQFSYCALVQIIHCRSNNSKINRLHENCFRIIYFDKQISYEI